MYKVDFEKPIHVYFMGIGGISMSGLAEILLQEGFTVSGSDMKESEITEILKNLGARIFIGQKAENISDDIDLVVYTAAIHADNPEFVEVKRRNIPMLTRAQLLGQIMLNYKYGVAVSGTHGKTTTTSMLSYVLLEAQTDPTISIGGMLDAIGGNIRVGHSDYFVTEACEYTNSYHAFHPYISIILNVDADHLDFFSGIEEIADSFKTFAEILPDDGLLVVNGDMKYYEHVTKDLHCNIITFGMNAGNDYSATDITFDEEGHPTYTLVVKGEKQDQIKLHATGIHNVMNSLSVIAVADFLGIDRKYTIAGLARCSSAPDGSSTRASQKMVSKLSTIMHITQPRLLQPWRLPRTHHTTNCGASSSLIHTPVPRRFWTNLDRHLQPAITCFWQIFTPQESRIPDLFPRRMSVTRSTRTVVMPSTLATSTASPSM